MSDIDLTSEWIGGDPPKGAKLTPVDPIGYNKNDDLFFIEDEKLMLEFNPYDFEKAWQPFLKQ